MIHLSQQAKNHTKELEDVADELLALCTMVYWPFCTSFRSVPYELNCTSMLNARTDNFITLKHIN